MLKISQQQSKSQQDPTSKQEGITRILVAKWNNKKLQA
jgi:hypothetical protein